MDSSNKSDRFTLGIIGASLGAGIGGALYVVAHMAGWYAALVGAIMAFLTIGGYRLFSKKSQLDRKGLIAVIIIMVLVLIVAIWSSWVIEGQEVLVKEVGAANMAKLGFKTFGDYFFKLGDIISMADGWGDFFADAAQGFLFTAIGCVSVVSSIAKNTVIKKDK